MLDGCFVTAACGIVQRLQQSMQLKPTQMFLACPQDARVRGGQRVIADQQFFIEFFTGAQAGELDGDVATRVLRVAHRQP